MVSTIPSVFLAIASIVLISSTNAANPPGNYTLPKGSINLCFAARFNLTLNVEYLQIDGKTNFSKIPLNSKTFFGYDGTCETNNTHNLKITMFDGLTTITFTFFLNEKNQTLLKRVFGTITTPFNNDYFPNATNIGVPYVFIANESLFETNRGNSYRCNTKTKIDNFDKNRNFTIKSIDFENLRIQPFVDNTTVFNDYAVEKVCAMDIIKGSNLIPIIVGVCLGILVIVVLVVYLVARRRNRNGYQSV